MWHDPITRITLGMSIMFSFYWLCQHFVVSPLLASNKLSKDRGLLVGMSLLYIPGLGLLFFLLKDLPKSPLSPQNFTLGNYLLVFFAQFFAFVLMAMFSFLESKLGLIDLQSLKQQKEERDNEGLGLFLLILVVPFLEELLSRKILAELLGPDQLRLFLYTSALIFSLIHLQTGRLAVAAGMFYTGFLWAWVYAASGSLILCTVYHGLFNLLMVFLPEYLEKKVDGKVHGLYVAALALVGTVSFVILLFNRAHYLPAARPDAESISRRVFGNWGFCLLAAACVLSYLYARRARRDKQGCLPEKQ